MCVCVWGEVGLEVEMGGFWHQGVETDRFRYMRSWIWIHMIHMIQIVIVIVVARLDCNHEVSFSTGVV